MKKCWDDPSVWDDSAVSQTHLGFPDVQKTLLIPLYFLRSRHTTARSWNMAVFYELCRAERRSLKYREVHTKTYQNNQMGKWICKKNAAYFSCYMFLDRQISKQINPQV